MDVLEDQHYDESETDSEFSDDSTDDPTFDLLDETRLTFSNLSIERKIKRRVVKGTDEKEGGDSTVTEMIEPELDEQGQKSYETIQKIIEDGQVEKLKVEECKIYLRRNVLRLSGTKDVLIQRIKEHVDIVNGGGEKKYPASSFVLNCKGDACMGDVVMFEQNMYGMFNIASRSANGPPCGTRVVAGRIVKESYGAAKQQHTFTIEVLWSKGEKRLPPLHPLLIKGRNLYRLKTMRQKWDDEGERQKILSEKHARGGVARCNREARIQQREMRKIRKQNRATRKQRPNRKQEEEKQDPLHSVSVKPENLTIQAKQRQQDPKNTQKQQSCKQKINSYPRTCGLNIPIQLNSVSKAHVPLQGHLQRQPLISMNCSFPRDQHINSQFSNFDSLRSTRGGFHEEQHINYNRMRKTLCGFDENRHRSQSQQSHLYHRQDLNAARNPAFQQKQTCRYYVQGRCRFGDRCKYLHELARNGV